MACQPKGCKVMDSKFFVRMKVVERAVVDSMSFDLEFRDRLVKKSYPIVIKINEGPDLSTVTIFDRPFQQYLDQMIREHGADSSKIYIEVDNLVHDIDFYKNIVRNFTGVDFDHAKNIKYRDEKHLKKHFGLFIGCSRWPRLFLAVKLFDMARENSFISYQQKHFQKNLGANLGFDQMMIEAQDKDKNLARQFAQLNDHLPLSVVSDTFENNNGGYINFTEAYDLLELYKHIFVDIVCETWHIGKTFMPTEKIVRPLISKTPFIVYGPKNYLSNLKTLGFRTFDGFWNESYDKFSGYERLVKIIKLIEQFKIKPLPELQKILTDMDDVLEHNQNLYKKINAKDIMEKFNANT